MYYNNEIFIIKPDNYDLSLYFTSRNKFQKGSSKLTKYNDYDYSMFKAIHQIYQNVKIHNNKYDNN